MERTPKLIMSLAIIIIIALGLGFYVYFQSRDFLQGPTLNITDPLPGSMSTTSFISIRGRAQNVAFITLDGRQIFTDELGRFNESLLLEGGYNIIAVSAKDRFGHKVEKRLGVVYKPEHDTDATTGPGE